VSVRVCQWKTRRRGSIIFRRLRRLQCRRTETSAAEPLTPNDILNADFGTRKFFNHSDDTLHQTGYNDDGDDDDDAADGNDNCDEDRWDMGPGTATATATRSTSAGPNFLMSVPRTFSVEVRKEIEPDRLGW